jgi:hypothetical protein
MARCMPQKARQRSDVMLSISHHEQRELFSASTESASGFAAVGCAVLYGAGLLRITPDIICDASADKEKFCKDQEFRNLISEECHAGFRNALLQIANSEFERLNVASRFFQPRARTMVASRIPQVAHERSIQSATPIIDAKVIATARPIGAHCVGGDVCQAAQLWTRSRLPQAISCGWRLARYRDGWLDRRNQWADA